MESKVIFCPRCGKDNADSFAFCPSCGAKVGGAPLGEKQQLSRIAGILDFTSAGLSAVILLVAIWYGPLFTSPDEPWAWLINVLSAAGVIVWLVGTVVSIVGGICALKRRNWGWAIAGAAAATAFGIWFLGLAALILTAISRDEFRRPLDVSHNA